MVGISSPNLVENRARDPFRTWDAFDRLFDEAFSRTKSRPLSPDIGSPLSSRFPEAHAYAHAGATPYASGSPAMSSNESLGFSGADEPDRNEAFDRIWNEGLRRTRRSTVTTSRTVKRNKRMVESSGSNTTSTSNDTSSKSEGPPVPPVSPVPPPPPPPPPPLESAKSPRLKKRRSKVNFKDSADGRTVTATFELQGVNKSDVHVSYQNDKVVVSWESVTTAERMEGDRLIRERREKKYARTLPLPEGTKFEEIRASMDGRNLVLTYPKFMARKPIQVIEIKTE